MNEASMIIIMCANKLIPIDSIVITKLERKLPEELLTKYLLYVKMHES
jgi:hypothetical protein